MKDNLIVTFHANEVCLIDAGTLKCNQTATVNKILPDIEATRLCRHGITANFDISEHKGFICVVEIKSEDVNKVKPKLIHKPEKEDKNFKGKNLWLMRLELNNEEDNLVPYKKDEESMVF